MSTATATSPTVLVIDDDEVTVRQFSQMLRLEGFGVLSASDARTGLQQAALGPDVIILDLRIPVTDGVGILQCLREQPAHRDTPVVIVTGDYFMDDAVQRELKRLRAEVRYKPLWLEELLVIVRGALDSRSASAASHDHQFAGRTESA